LHVLSSAPHLGLLHLLADDVEAPLAQPLLVLRQISSSRLQLDTTRSQASLQQASQQAGRQAGREASNGTH
jgi:hypothetical protein